jgi:hypothetical protein
MMLQTVTPEQARRLIGGGAILVDIREAHEHARERIPKPCTCRCRSSTRRSSLCTRASR